MKSIHPSLLRPERDGTHRRDIPTWYLQPIRTHAEIAKILGLSKSQVATAEERGLKKLRLLLETSVTNPQLPNGKDNIPSQGKP